MLTMSFFTKFKDELPIFLTLYNGSVVTEMIVDLMMYIQTFTPSKCHLKNMR
jgi:hypothetical protein